MYILVRKSVWRIERGGMCLPVEKRVKESETALMDGG